MLKEKTCCIIKPGAYARYFRPMLMNYILPSGFKIRLAGEFMFNPTRCHNFYNEHVGKPFYDHLVEVMCEAPCFGMVLEREIAIPYLRDLMGPTKIEDRRPGELRFEYGDPTVIARNAVHGSDSPEAAEVEIALLKQWLLEGIQ